MAIVALNSLDEMIVAADIREDENIRQPWRCKNEECKTKRMLYVDSNLKAKYFRHYIKGSCDESEPETIEHVEMKYGVYEYFKSIGRKCEYEFKIGNRRTDIMTTDSYGKKMAVECQVSPITINEIQSRNKDYESNDYNYMWILNTKNYLKYLYPENKEYGSVNWRTFKLKAVESEFYEMDWLFYWIENKIIKLKLYSNDDFKTHFYLSERNNSWLESYIKGK